MKHRRFRIRGDSIEGEEAIIRDPGEVRHISKVLRLGPGDRVTLFDGEGKEYPARISRISGDQAWFTLLREPSPSNRESSLRIILGAALLRPAKFEFLLQKSTELGVAEIAPFYSGHVVPRLEKSHAENRQTRWEKIVSEAAKQCGRARIPRIHPPRGFEEILRADFGAAVKIFLWEKEGAESHFPSFNAQSAAALALVGPEGGFSDDEANQAKAAGFQPIRLGPRILRAETAGIVIVGLLQFLAGDLH